MGLFESISRALGRLGALSDKALEVEREALRQRYVASDDVDDATNLYNELHRYDAELGRRSNEAYEREHPGGQEIRHREHGWYLPNDD